MQHWILYFLDFALGVFSKLFWKDNITLAVVVGDCVLIESSLTSRHQSECAEGCVEQKTESQG